MDYALLRLTNSIKGGDQEKERREVLGFGTNEANDFGKLTSI